MSFDEIKKHEDENYLLLQVKTFSGMIKTYTL